MVDLTQGRQGWYNSYMSEDRAEIVAKIEAKKSAHEKLTTKADNLQKQNTQYENAISEHEAKIAKLKVLMDKNNENVGGYLAEAEDRAGEIQHMEEILARYDAASSERIACLKKMQDRRDAFPDWYPGMDESLKGAFAKDPEYRRALDRAALLDHVMEAALPDVKKLFYSRGTIAGFNEKGAGNV